MKKNDEKRLNAAEMWFYRRLLRVSYKDRRTNESILKELNTSLRMLSSVYSRKLKYLGHTIRNKKCQLMKLAIQGKFQGKRRRGRPQTAFLDNVQKVTGLSTVEIFRAAEDRERWRTLSRTSALSATVRK